MNKKKILQALKADFKAAETYHDDIQGKIDTWIDWHDGKPYGNERKGKSAIVTRDIKKQSEWQHASIIDPFVSDSKIIKCIPITAEDVQSAKQNELVLNTQFCRQFNRFSFMTKAVKVLDREGTVVIQTGWDYKDTEVEVEVPVIEVDPMTGQEVIVGYEIEMQTKVLVNKPTATVCRNEDIYIDPTCQDDMDNCQFVIYRYESDLSTLRQDGRYKNLDKIVPSKYDDSDYEDEDDSEFEFEDDPRKKIVVYEYWGNYDMNDDGIAEPIVCTWVDDTIIRLQSNPYPDNKPPFIIVPFNSVPFQMHGEANAELIGDNQKIKTAITRGIIDNMAQSNNGQKGIRKGALDVQNRKRFLNGDNFEFNGTPNDFWDGSYNQIPGSAFNMLDLMNNEIESITGTKSFSGGISGNSLGHMLDINTDIPLIDGTFKKLVDIQDGDKLIGSDGKATTVVKAHSIKLPEIAYDMEFDNGSTVKSGGEHLWTVKVHGTSHKLREWTTMDADEVYRHMQNGRRVTIPKMKEIHTGNPTNNKIDPYVLGYWLGDGMSHSARITTEDNEVIDNFTNAGYVCVAVKDSSKTGNATMYDVYKPNRVRISDKGPSQATDSLHSELRALGLHARYGGEKHIPEEYFNATYEEKMELIRGLMDSDGYAHSGSFVQFCQSEGRLKDDMIRLLKTLGLKVSVLRRDMDERNAQKIKLCEKTGAKVIWQRKDSYEIGFTPWSNPFKLSRKASKWKQPRKETVTLKSMTIVDKVHMRCLTVDSKDKLFAVTDKYTLTHNTATGARGALDATSTRRLNVVRNIAENMIKPLMRKWLAYNAEFLSETEVVRITNEEFVDIRRDDLAGKLDLDIEVSTAEDNAAKVQELSFLLQTLGPSEDPAVRRGLMADIYELMRMPDKADMIRNYQPQQDPFQEQMKQIELAKAQAEVEKIKAETVALYSSAHEDDADKAEKMAQAQYKMAQTKKLLSEADMIDLKFIKEDEDAQHQNEMEKKEFDRLANLDQMAFQAMHNDTNIGVMK